MNSSAWRDCPFPPGRTRYRHPPCTTYWFDDNILDLPVRCRQGAVPLRGKGDAHDGLQHLCRRCKTKGSSRRIDAISASSTKSHRAISDPV